MIYDCKHYSFKEYFFFFLMRKNIFFTVDSKVNRAENAIICLFNSFDIKQKLIIEVFCLQNFVGYVRIKSSSFELYLGRFFQ